MTDIRLGGASRRRGGFFKTLLLALLATAVVALGAAAWLLFEFERPTVALDRELRFLGGRVELPLHAADKKSGLRALEITLVQGERSVALLDRTFPRQSWFGAAGPATVSEKVAIDAQKAGIKEGSAELVVRVRDFSLNGLFRGNRTELRMPVTMDTKPPTLALAHAQRSIRPGGSGLVVYTVSEPPARHGLQVGERFFPGFPGAKANTFVAYFALPWDTRELGSTRVVAADEAGNEAALPFAASLRKVPEKRDAITISDGFLAQKLPEFQAHYPEMQGSPVEQYLYVNNQVRVQNAEVIARVCADTDPQQLWADRFLRMPGAGRAQFADQRTYLYNGQAIDTQTHLGVDIASTAQAPIRAANRGRVVFADYLGIYGNMIILDHGQGIASLYSHLSTIETTVGTLVEKDQPIGRSGASGMAGGDHLHFSMLVHGLFVTPVEWWDQHWIDVTIKNALHGQ